MLPYIPSVLFFKLMSGVQQKCDKCKHILHKYYIISIKLSLKTVFISTFYINTQSSAQKIMNLHFIKIFVRSATPLGKSRTV